MNFFGLSEGGGVARKVVLVLFLFTGTGFLGAIENEERWFGNTGFLEGREKVQVVVK